MLTAEKAKQLYDKLSPFLVVPQRRMGWVSWQGLKIDETKRHLTFEEFCREYLGARHNIGVSWDE